jgi:Ni/Fe-hydrogenase 1 B-type cytochrome subunit
MTEKTSVKQRHWVFILLHWLIVGCLGILMFTGYYIHHPFFSIGSGEESLIMTMAWIRWIHFVTAAVLIESVAIRLELAFFSHFDADWRDVGPSMRSIRALPEAISYYLFLRKDHRYWRKLNPVITVILVPIWLLFFLIAVLTGFALLQGTFFWGLTTTNTLFGWIFNLFGGEQNVRTWHFYLIFVFLSTGAISVYLSIIRTLDERDNTFRSMLSGWRLIRGKYAPIKGGSGVSGKKRYRRNRKVDAEE